MNHYTDQELLLIADDATLLKDSVRKHFSECKVCKARFERFLSYKKALSEIKTPKQNKNIFELYPVEQGFKSKSKSSLAASTSIAQKKFVLKNSFATVDNIILLRTLWEENEKKYLVHIIGEGVQVSFAMFSYDEIKFFISDENGLAKIDENEFVSGKNCKIILPVINYVITHGNDGIKVTSDDNTVELTIHKNRLEVTKGEIENLKICLYKSQADYSFITEETITHIQELRLLVYKM